jgi:hypothetical protein
VNVIYKQAWQLQPGYVIRSRSTGRDVTIRRVKHWEAGEKQCLTLSTAFVTLDLLDEDFFIIADPATEYRVLRAVKLPRGANKVTGFWRAVRERAAAPA